MHIRSKLARLLAASANFFQLRAGTFLSGTFSSSAGTRPYKLYVPRNYSSSIPIPLLVALHGCTQDPDNFAAGTRFNLLADTYNFIVLYPQQTSTYQPNKCWAWYDPSSQVRGSGEPAIIAGMVDYVTSQYTIDESRVFITGMSAGAAMAVIMGCCYPDYFAAVGVHSGLEYKAASDLISAQIALSQGGPDPNTQGKNAYLSAGSAARLLPVIVFHGNSDYTVFPLNGDQVLQQLASTNDYADDGVANNSVNAAPSSTQTGQVPNGYSYTIYNYDYKGQVLMQKYKVDGLGHAWSGGSNAPPATFTDPKGPDASTIMWNFFASHPKVESTPTPIPTVERGHQDIEEAIEGVFRYMADEPSPGTSSASPRASAALALTRRGGSGDERSGNPAGTSTDLGVLTLYSIGSKDGYVMRNFPYNGDLSVGSLAGTQQFAFLSFDTSRIPASVIIDSVTLKIVRNYASAGNAFEKLGSLVADMKGGSGFSDSPALQGSDGHAPADASAVCTMSVASAAGEISQGSIASSAFQYITCKGKTQFRLRFTVVSENSYSTDYIGFFGGESTNAQATRPMMVIIYHK